MNTGIVLLAGGKSRRMGADKTALPFGNKTLLEHLAETYSDYPEKLLSVGADTPTALEGYTLVPDAFGGCGPMAGLHAALAHCHSEALLTLTCDVPLFGRDLAEHLVQSLTPEWDAVVIVTRDGRIHPYCAVYRKALAPFFEAKLAGGRRYIIALLEELRVLYKTLADTPYPDSYLTNINTPTDYDALLHATMHTAAQPQSAGGAHR